MRKIRPEKQIDEANDIGLGAINLLRLKNEEVLKLMQKTKASYSEQKRLKRLHIAILRSIEDIRRSLLEDKVYRNGKITS